MGRTRQWSDDNTVSITLMSGGSVTLMFKGNVFDLTEDERRLVGDLTTTIKRYREDSELVPAAQPAEDVDGARPELP